jgi:hypothetical protein
MLAVEQALIRQCGGSRLHLSLPSVVVCKEIVSLLRVENKVTPGK